MENEKLIRHYRAADQMLFSMAKGLLIKVDETVKHSLSKGFYLKDIMPDNKKSILETRIKFSIPFKVGYTEKKVSDVFKIKEYGKFRKYLKDKRIVSLLSYFKESEIPKPDLDKQLKDYERSRHTLFEAIYYFEVAISKNTMFAEEINHEKTTQKTYVEHRKLLEWYLPASEENDILKKQLNNIRNKFSHNEYPDHNLMIPILKGEKPFIDEITDFATTLYRSFSDQLNKGEIY